MSNDAKLQPHKFHTEDEQGKAFDPDWGLIASNQITMITQQSTMLAKQQEMVDELRRIANSELLSTLTRQQMQIVDAVNNLSDRLDAARGRLDQTMEKLSGSIMGIVQVPITIVVMGIASAAFYLKYIEEWTWLLILAVAAFRYLGDSITAVVKLFNLGGRLQRDANGGAQGRGGGKENR